MTSRRGLVDVLKKSCASADLRRGVTVDSLVAHRDGVEVTFDDGGADRFDAVIACDGTSSPTRELVFGPAAGFDSGWVLQTWWANTERFASDLTGMVGGRGGSSGPTRLRIG